MMYGTYQVHILYLGYIMYSECCIVHTVSTSRLTIISAVFEGRGGGGY